MLPLPLIEPVRLAGPSNPPEALKYVAYNLTNNENLVPSCLTFTNSLLLNHESFH